MNRHTSPSGGHLNTLRAVRASAKALRVAEIRRSFNAPQALRNREHEKAVNQAIFRLFDHTASVKAVDGQGGGR